MLYNNHRKRGEEVELVNLEKDIGYTFKNKQLLNQALTHTSYAYENNLESNEKLEFLGDSILEFISSKYLYNNYTKLKEGEMTKVRASVVCENSLYKIAQKHDFSNYIKLGKSEKKTCKNGRPAILADSVEALIAAIYIDGGLKEAEKFIINNLSDEIKNATNHVGEKDYKTVLQEKLQVKGEVKIEYILIKETGPDHDKNFEFEIRCDGKKLATGSGKSKKLAQMQAAKKAIELL